MSNAGQLLTAQLPERGALYLKPIGHCTAALTATIRQHLPSLLGPETQHVYFDLESAPAADSTFIGFLLMLARPRGGDIKPAIHLAGMQEPVRDALTRMHLLGLFTVCTALPDSACNWCRLDGRPVTADELADLVLAAHEQIIEADDRNAAAFGRVVEGFRAARDKRAAENTESE